MRKWINIEFPHNCDILYKLTLVAEEFEHAMVFADLHTEREGWYKTLNKETTLAAFGSLSSIVCNINSLSNHLNSKDWYMGFITYDAKDEIFPELTKKQSAKIAFPNVHFFRPKWIVRFNNSNWQIGFDSMVDDETSAIDFGKHIINTQNIVTNNSCRLNIKPTVDFNSYNQSFNNLQHHIHRGDVYELNYCIEFADDDAQIFAPSMFLKLMQRSPMPFAAYLKYKNKYALCASPERYLTKTGSKVTSMPMKGTAARGNCANSDTKNLSILTSSVKERTENIMITDLVRNDLSRVAAKGSVVVDELCGAYPFPGVFQVVSTISAQLKKPTNWFEPVVNSFPMGSMTGAPKLSAMQLINKHEQNSRGLFAGAMGYITPDRDFDFNVVIRTLFYDKDTNFATYYAGSAITAQANALDEYNECLLKAKNVLNF